MSQQQDNSAQRVTGAALIKQIREGWAPLPTRTLFALAMGGLRVRMMRSAVTMLSIVLAIAFLTYTGLVNKLTFNLAEGVQQREKQVGLSAVDVSSAAASLAAFDPFAAMSAQEHQAVARTLRMDDVDEKQGELATLRQQARSAKLKLDDAQSSHDKVTADAAASAADRVEAAAALRSARDTHAQRERAFVQARDVVELGLYLRGQKPQNIAEPDQALAQRLRESYAALVALMSTPSRYDAQQIEDLLFLLDLADRAGRGEQVAQLRGALDLELAKRATADLKTRLRKAGVSIEATLAGNPMDLWLIIMAMLTCAVGIANAMLMSVTERFREIGTMKCLGAQDGLVVKLFLMESGVLGVVGALIGIVLGVLVALGAAVAQFAGYGLSYFPVFEAADVVLMSVLGGIILAVVGAVYPAFAASRMKPVDALRVDE